MRKTFALAALTLAAAISTPALASGTLTSGGTFTFTEGGAGGLGAGETLYASFDPGSTAGVDPSMIYTGSFSGIAADPAVLPMGDPYLAVMTGQVANFTFAGLSQLGLDYGSADAYNSFQLFFADGTNQTLTGQNIIDIGDANGDQLSPRTNGRLTFNAGTGSAITGLRLTSTGNSLESDTYGVVAAVPEPSTWAMMLIGFGAAGASMRRRKRVFAMQAA